MPVYLKALALRHYRGIGADTQAMPAFKKFNFFIGANNAGKSTVLNFISRHLPIPRNSPFAPRVEAKPLHALERHDGAGDSSIYMALGFTVDDALADVSLIHAEELEYPEFTRNLRKVLEALAGRHGLIWKGGNLPYGEKLTIQRSDDKIRPLLPENEWQRLWATITRQRGGGPNHWISETIAKIEDALDTHLPVTQLIPAIRQIAPSNGDHNDFSGIGLVERLASIQNPEHDRRHDKDKFDRINKFLRHVTGRPNAEIEIPYSREHILVHMDGRILPLSSLGTGIQEVIMIAAFCTLSENEIICIEEPEIHLHPLLQRKLIGYLSQNTTNQYFVATHSAAFIDTPGAAIFHVYQEDNKTQIREAVLRKERYAICADLGHRASDIVQANAVIWVEGPSDRTYLNHWIKIAAPDLVESIHYSIMFYGGRLLNHLSADDEEVTEFIQLRSLNRNLAIIMDSDRAHSRAAINSTKLRLKAEFEKHGGVAWITKGREIENYIDHARLQGAVKAVYGDNYDAPLPSSQFDHALHFQRTAAKKRRGGKTATDLVEREVDKVKISRAVSEDGSNDLSVLDLKERIEEVVALIRKAND